MRMAKYFVGAILTMGLAASLGVFRAADEDKPKYDIETIMKKAHGGKANSLYNKVRGGKANEQQQKQLLEYYEELAKNKPPKGDLDDWKKRTGAIVKATKGIIAGEKGASAALSKAANCSKCHELHKED